MCDAAKSTVWCRRLLKDFGCHVNAATPLHCDNAAALILAQTPIVSGKSKHIEIRFHYVRECISKGKLKPHFLEGARMIADLLTKNLTKGKYDYFIDKVVQKCQT